MGCCFFCLERKYRISLRDFYMPISLQRNLQHLKLGLIKRFQGSPAWKDQIRCLWRFSVSVQQHATAVSQHLAGRVARHKKAFAASEMIKEYILVANDISLEHNDTMLVEKMKSGALNEFEKIFFLAHVRQSRYCVITMYDHIPESLEGECRHIFSHMVDYSTSNCYHRFLKKKCRVWSIIHLHESSVGYFNY